MSYAPADRLPDYRLDPPDEVEDVPSKRQCDRENKAIAYLKHTRCADGKQLLAVAESLYMGVVDDTEACEDMETLWGIARKYWGSKTKPEWWTRGNNLPTA